MPVTALLLSACIANSYAGITPGVPETAPASVLVLQQKSLAISGTIVDASEQPVIGANVLEKGTTNGTITDYGR